ncbi:MAG TPA: LLM class flavin-dependent oxidoreductase [Actinomycetota bacterium]|jgi:alkanesulfonate monooxygenase SsuD/methylene tetrahydromethanopterin reductase-like flavin-dependent oxidoreductase (luciferase family)|nr:LLM class flavin-dependent oxidoreductase [Actinomycetota bacterium]
MAAIPRVTGTAFALRDPYPWGHLSGLARIGESLGYRAMFMPEVGSRDVLAALTGIAGETAELLLGSGVLPLPGRSPQLLAQAGATVQDRSNGRLILGIGAGPAARGALDRLRATVAMLRDAFAGETATTPEGEPFRLALVPASPPPIWIAALGPRAMRLAGAVADGVLLNWCTPERVARARVELDEGAAAAGREPAEVSVGVYVRACVHADAEAASLAVRAAAAQYASYPAYARQFARMGLGEEAGRAAEAHAAARPADVPEHFVRAVAALGDPAAARARLEEYRSAGADLVVVYPVIVPGSALARSALTTLESLAPNG